jgi:hypothetical protein
MCPRGDLNPETGEISLDLGLNSKTGEKSPDRGVHAAMVAGAARLASSSVCQSTAEPRLQMRGSA